MRPKPASSPLRRFLRGLTNTCLLFLLPVQLGLVWLAQLDRPARLPDFLAERVTAALAAEGIGLRARALWILPDLTLAADDLALSVDGLSEDVFAAGRAELALHPGRLLAGEFAVTRLRLSRGRLWCPASVARGGARRQLVDELAVDLAREGRWMTVRLAQARGGKITCHLRGEAPADLFVADDEEEGADEPPARLLAHALGAIEQAMDVAERSGGATVSVVCAGRGDGGAEISAQALLGDDWAGEQVGLIQAQGLSLRGSAQVSPAGHLGAWRLTAEARAISWARWSATRCELRADENGAEISLADVRGADLELPRVVARFAGDPRRGGSIALRIQSRASFAEGSVERLADGRIRARLGHAVMSGDEISAAPVVAGALRRAAVELRGELLLRDGELMLTAAGAPATASGELALSGFRGLGLSADAISPDADLPLRARFDYAAGRTDAQLRLRELRLASVTGEADCALAAGGAFSLRLRGELAPASLDGVLGDWWVSLWRLFLVRENPYAFIDVDGRWGARESMTKGRVLLRRFDFMGAPFRRVEVSVAADARRTHIGLHGLQGGDSAADGSADGTADWDWSKPVALAGPVVRLDGDLRPWVAARCGGKEFGEALRGLDLPPTRRLGLRLEPGQAGLEIRTTLECAGEFTAWGVPGRDLRAETTTLPERMRIEARLGLAAGQAELTLEGDPLRRAKLRLSLQGCDPVQVGQLISAADAPARAPAGQGRLDLGFTGEVDVADLRSLHGRGTYALTDPGLKKVRLLGGVSGLLETLGVGATTYELNQARGTFGCTGGKAYFPDMAITGPQARLDLAGEMDLRASTVLFEGDFSLPRKQGFNPLDMINLNRALVSLTKIRLEGPVSQPKTTALRTLKDIIKPKKDNDLGKIPASISE